MLGSITFFSNNISCWTWLDKTRHFNMIILSIFNYFLTLSRWNDSLINQILVSCSHNKIAVVVVRGSTDSVRIRKLGSALPFYLFDRRITSDSLKQQATASHVPVKFHKAYLHHNNDNMPQK